MQSIVVYGVGSPLIADYEESARRANVTIVAAVRNMPGSVYFSDDKRVVDAESLSDEMKTLPAAFPFFTPANRRAAVVEAERRGFTTHASLIDPTSILPAAFQFGPGLYINAGCTLGGASRLGRFVIINRGATIGHHADIGDYCSIGPGVVIAGNVTIGSGSLIGAGAVLAPKCVIGRNAVVGAGAVVTREVPDDAVVIGNPARLAGRRPSDRGAASTTPDEPSGT